MPHAIDSLWAEPRPPESIDMDLAVTVFSPELLNNGLPALGMYLTVQLPEFGQHRYRITSVRQDHPASFHVGCVYDSAY